MGIFDLLNPKTSILESGILNGAVDRHSHILYAVDDGVKTPEKALAALEYEESLGVREVWCTPHIMEDVPNTTESLKRRFDELCELYNGPIKLRLAAEYMIDNLFEERLKNRDLLLMEDNMLLIETSTVVAPYNFSGIIDLALSKGYRPVLAHPERSRFFEKNNDLENFVEKGVLLQLNLGSLSGYYGPSVKRNAENLLKKGWYFAFGSDFHKQGVVDAQYSKPVLTKNLIKKIGEIK